MHFTPFRLLAVSGVLVAASSVVRADFTNPQEPTWRGSPKTHFAGYESFTEPVALPNLPDDPNTTATDVEVAQLVPGAILVSGNIYNPAGPSQFELTDELQGRAVEVWLQTSTLGVELDYDEVRLSYTDADGGEQLVPWTRYTELARIPGMGVNVESLFEWDLAGIPATVDSFTLSYQGVGAHMSLDALLLDVRYDTAVEFYCTAKSGLVCGIPVIDATGCSSASASSGFELLVQPALGNKAGLVLYSEASSAIPFQGGFLCVSAPLFRTSPVTSGGTQGLCDGTFRIDMNAFAQGQLGGNPAPFLLTQGAQVFAQWWGRDTVATGSFLSDALQYEVGP